MAVRIHRPSSQAGFSLTELLVVIIIISILAGVVAVALLDAPGQAKVAAARSQVDVMYTALTRYKLAHNRFPSKQQGLDALVKVPTASPVPTGYPQYGYLESRTLPLDPWDNPYVYLVPGRDVPVEVLSYGSDGEPGGEGDAADISSADP